jgi:hypothetical protein
MRRVTSGTSANACAKTVALLNRSPPPHLRAASAALATIAALLADRPAAADEVEACATASEKGQELRDQGKLRAARELFVTCAAAECPAIVQRDCTAWLASVDEKLPSVALHARDRRGRDLTEVRVTIDGEVVAERLDGRALVLDPGAHTFRFAAAGAPEVEQKLLLREGEKGRLVDVVLGPPEAPKPPKIEERRFSIPAASWVLGAVALGGFGALAGFGVSAKSAVDDMRASCAPGCAPERVDAARRDMILANVGLGVGVAALGAAVVIAAVHDSAPPAKPAAAAWISAGPGGLSISGAW